MKNMLRKTIQKLALLTICFGLTGCELYNAEPHGKESKTDVLSAQKGGPSAEHLLSFFNPLLQEEVEGKRALGPSGSYADYWKSRMAYVATHESEAYYNRVFQNFNQARVQLGLKIIEVPDYASFHQAH
jgi:hypothetical protein